MNRSSSAKARKPFKPPSRLGTVPGVKAPVGHKPGAEKVVNIADALEREAEVDEEIRRLEEKGFRREQLQVRNLKDYYADFYENVGFEILFDMEFDAF